jgi:hypothetical protein
MEERPKKLLNFYKTLKPEKIVNPAYAIHQIKLPFRMLVCTASGGGKTNFVTNLLYHMSHTFTRIEVVTKADEPLYDMIKDRLESVRIHIYDTDGIPDIDTTDKTNKLLILDDLVLEKDKAIGQAFIRSRKVGWSVIYISQSYFGVPKLVRQNVNYVALGRGINKRDLRMILSEYSMRVSEDELLRFYNQATERPMNFLLLDMVKPNIRHNLFDVLWPTSEPWLQPELMPAPQQPGLEPMPQLDPLSGRFEVGS